MRYAGKLGQRGRVFEGSWCDSNGFILGGPTKTNRYNGKV